MMLWHMKPPFQMHCLTGNDQERNEDHQEADKKKRLKRLSCPLYKHVRSNSFRRVSL